MITRSVAVGMGLTIALVALPSACNEPFAFEPFDCAETPCFRRGGLEGLEIVGVEVGPQGVYAGTLHNGLFRLAPGSNWRHEGFENAVPSAILARDSDVFVGVRFFSAESTSEAAVYRSRTGTAPWRPSDGGHRQDDETAWAYSLAEHPTQPNILFWGQSFSLLRSLDNGHTWSFVMGRPGQNAAGIWDIEVSASGDTIWAGGASALSGSVFVWSFDGGEEWNESPGRLRSGVIKDILSDPENSAELWAAYSGAVIHSQNAGMDWEVDFFDQSIIEEFVSLIPTEEGLLAISSILDPDFTGDTHLGMRLRLDSGEWLTIMTPDDVSGARDAAVDSEGVLWIATLDGLWRAHMDQIVAQARSGQ